MKLQRNEGRIIMFVDLKHQTETHFVNPPEARKGDFNQDRDALLMLTRIVMLV